MKKSRMLMVVCGVLMLGGGSMFVSQRATAQEGAAPAPPPMTAEQMKQMGAMMDMMSKPAEEHRVLAGMEGTWDVTTDISFPGMGNMTSHSTTTAKWILGGRFLQVDTISKPDEPMHVESMTIYGFDTRTKKYTMFGIDTIGTYSVSAQGDYDGEKKTMVLKGENEEPGVGKMPFEWNVRFEGTDKWIQEIWFDMPQPMGRTKIVALTAVRVK